MNNNSRRSEQFKTGTYFGKSGVGYVGNNPPTKPTDTVTPEILYDMIRAGDDPDTQTLHLTKKQFLALLNTHYYSLMEEAFNRIEVPTINDVFPDKPYDGTHTWDDMMQVVNYYKDSIEREKKRLKEKMG